MNAPWPSLIVDQEQFEDASVHELFHKCYDAHKHLSDLPKAADEAQAVLRKLLAMLQRCDTMIDTTGLFSDNEDQEDISTGSLRYFATVISWSVFAKEDVFSNVPRALASEARWDPMVHHRSTICTQ